MPAGATAVLADIEGPGTISYLWLTSDLLDYRALILRCAWDDEAEPSVETPLGALLRDTISPFDVFKLDWEIVGSHAINYTFQQARDLLAFGRVPVKPMITRIAGLGDVADILGSAKTDSELKTLIDPLMPAQDLEVPGP